MPESNRIDAKAENSAFTFYPSFAGSTVLLWRIPAVHILLKVDRDPVVRWRGARHEESVNRDTEKRASLRTPLILSIPVRRRAQKLALAN